MCIVGSTTGCLNLLIEKLSRPSIIITTFPLSNRNSKREWVAEGLEMKPGWVSWSQGPKDCKLYIYYIGLF